MRHATRSQRLSKPSAHRQALVDNLVRNLILYGSIRTTWARAKEAQRSAEKLITLGKEGSIHARRRAFRVLQDQRLVKQLFAEVAPRFANINGGYTRVVRTAIRRGDGAQKAVLALTQLPAVKPVAPAKAPKAAPSKPDSTKPESPQPKASEESGKSKGLLEGLRGLWTRKKKGSSAS